MTRYPIDTVCRPYRYKKKKTQTQTEEADEEENLEKDFLKQNASFGNVT